MSIETEIAELAQKFVPACYAGGILSRSDMKELIIKVANQAVVIGWSHAESMTRKRLEKKITQMEQEMSIMKDQMKSLELDLLAAESK
jgi:hypothetical protein